MEDIGKEVVYIERTVTIPFSVPVAVDVYLNVIVTIPPYRSGISSKLISLAGCVGVSVCLCFSINL